MEKQQNAQDFQSSVLTMMIANEQGENSIDDNPIKIAFLQGYFFAKTLIENQEPTPELYQEADQAYSIYCEAETQKVIDETLEDLLEEWGLEVAGADCPISEVGIAQCFYSESRGAIMRRDEEDAQGDITTRPYSDESLTDLIYHPDCIVTPLKELPR